MKLVPKVGVKPEELKKAVQKVGTSADAVSKHLGKQKGIWVGKLVCFARDVGEILRMRAGNCLKGMLYWPGQERISV
jgi:hypothetical protein